MLKNFKIEKTKLILVSLSAVLIVSLFGFFLTAKAEVLSPFKDAGQKIESFLKNWLGPKAGPEPAVLDNNVQSLPVDAGAQAYEDQIVKVVEKSAPSVVSIIISKDLPVFEQYYINPFQDFGFDLPGGLAVPQLRQKGTKKQEIGGGSGFIISRDGLVVTNRHVTADSGADYTVIFNDGAKLPAKVIARDPNFDLAILKVERTGLTPLALGDSDRLKLGKTVIAIGNALGEFKNTVSTGVISGLDRSVDVENETLIGLIQIDAAINKGNSGGPLLNISGEVVGINTAMALSAENIGFAIPINQVKKIIQNVEKNGSLKIAYLGIRYQMVTPDLKKEKNLAIDYGALVSSSGKDPGVEPGSPAEKAGLKNNDIILEAGGEKVSGSKTLVSILRNYNPGDKIFLKVSRQGSEITLEATLGEK